MVKYYGIIVNILDGSLEDIDGEFDWKPETEEGGIFGFCYWRKTIEERDKVRTYVINYIKKYKLFHKQTNEIHQRKVTDFI